MATETNKKNKRYERLMRLHEISYLTLLSIVQGVALGFLANKLPSSLAINSVTILFSTTFLIIVLTWNEYFMGVATLRWIPALFDSLIPFMFCMSEIFLINHLSEPKKWFIGMSIFGFIALSAFLNMYFRAGKHHINKDMLIKLGNYKIISVFFCIFFVGVFYLFWKVGYLWFEWVLPLLSFFIIVCFGFRTWLYWKRATS